MGQQHRRTTKLPQHVLDDLGIQAPTASKSSRLSRPEARKEHRKAARIQKKVRDTPHRSSKPQPQDVVSKRNHQSAVVRPSIATFEKPIQPKSILKSHIPKATNGTERTREVAISASSPPPLKPSKGIRDRLAQDDAEIAALEKALGLKGKKKLPKSFEEDGLDSLVEGLHDTSANDPSDSLKRRRSDEEDWLRNKRLKATGLEPEMAPSPRSVYSADYDEAELSQLSDDDLGGSDVDPGDSFSTDDAFESLSGEVTTSEPRARVRENPYIAPVAVPYATAPSKYVPPSKRRLEDGATGDDLRLQRQMKGLLNRLSETNLLSIMKDFEGVYRSHPRQDVTSTLLDLLMSLLCDPTSLQDTFIILHAGFIAALYRTIGADFGAQTISRVDCEIAELYRSRAQNEGNGKKLNNLVNLLAQLYNFKVIGSSLLYDFTRLFIEDLSEVNAELLLKIVRNSGSQLRKEDAASLKAINQSLQSAVAKSNIDEISVRTNFMVETINSLANKGLKTGKAESRINAEHTSRIKTMLSSLSERSVRASEPLNIRLKDLRDSDRRGKWWMVGASYRDDQFQQNDVTSQPLLPSRQDRSELGANSGDEMDLLQLARQLGFNTDIRRSIFVTLVSGEDFETACDRLRKLPINASQRAEIPRVLIRCSGAQEQYNPYYTLIARRIISRETKLKRAFQYSLWNLFEKIRLEGTEGDDPTAVETLGLRSLINHAKMFGTLIAEDGLSVGVLKDLNFAFLPEKLQQFAELILITVILRSQESEGNDRNENSLIKIFLGAKDAPEMMHGLRFFLKKAVSKTEFAGSREDQGTVKWGCKVARDTLNAIPLSTAAEARDL